MPYLLIPGTGGVNFNRATGERAPYALEIAAGRFAGWTDELVQELSCEHPEEAEEPWSPTRTSLLGDDGALIPREVLHASAYPVVDRAKYTMYPYDWRLDVRHNALLLIEYLRQQDEPARILAHSQGGLIVVAASLLCDSTAEFHQLVERLSLVAMPMMGTINAMDAMINGSNFGGSNTVFYRTASRTWPALFQMFPQWACVVNHPAKRSTSRALWPNESEAFRAMLARAKEYFQWIDYAPLRHIEKRRAMLVLGRPPASNTDVFVRATDEGPVIEPERGQGDTLVPYDITFAAIDEQGFRNRVMTVGGPHQPAHMRLLGDVRVYRDCDRFLSR